MQKTTPLNLIEAIYTLFFKKGKYISPTEILRYIYRNLLFLNLAYLGACFDSEFRHY